MTTPFLKGAAAQQAMQNEQAKADMRSNGTFRFYIKSGEERMITFLDGSLDANGLLDIPYINEHRVRIQGDVQNIACTEMTEPCPLCEAAQNNNSQDFGWSAFVGFLTVIDHTGYVDKQGVHHKDVVRLYVAKRKTIELLTKMAQSNGTLAGMCFNVSRSGDKVAAVGDIYVPQGQYNPQDLINHYKQQDPQSKVGILDYDKEVTYFDAATLRGMLGMGGAPMGGAPMGGAPVQQQYSHQAGVGQPAGGAPVGGMPAMQPAGQKQLPIAGDVSGGAPPMMTADHQAAPQKKLQMLATDFTREQYHASGWTDETLVANGKAKWEESQPPAPAAAPQPEAAPVQQTFQMIATDYTREQYHASGWTDEMLIEKGKAQLVGSAPAAAPQAAAPQAAPVPEAAPQAPFQPHDPNVPDTNTDYAGQL